MYCVKCGVELADSEKVCPLCGTRAFHPDMPPQQGQPPYPVDHRPHTEEVSRSGVLFLLTVLALLSAVLFILEGKVWWLLALPAAACNMLGAYCGARYAMKGGSKRVRGMIFVVLGLLFIKMGYELLF